LPIYSQDTIDQVREGNDIVSVVSQYVHLTKKGPNHFGLCPFHREKSPSFSVSEDKQFFHCFGCGAGGNVITFIMRIENYEFPDALKFLADRIHFELPTDNSLRSDNGGLSALKETLYEVNKTAARFFYDSLIGEDGKHAVEYLDERNVSVPARNRFGLGYSPGGKNNTLYNFLKKSGYNDDILIKSGLIIKNRNGDGFFDKFYGRLMFPIFDYKGRIVGFGGRIMGEGQPKYLNSPETAIFDKSSNLYAINFARKEKSDNLILAEGYMDVISLSQYGFKNAVAALGTAFNGNHIRQLKNYCKTVTLLFDSDEAGQKAALKAIDVLKDSGLKTRVLRLENAKDPDEFLNKFGASEFAKALDSALYDTDFLIKTAKSRYNLENSEGKVGFVKEASGIIAKLDSSIEKEVYAKNAADIAGVSEQSVKAEVSKREVGLTISEEIRASRAGMRGRTTAAKGIDEARRNILYTLASSRRFDDLILKHLQAEDLAEPIYIKLFDVIKNEKVKKGSVSRPNLPNYFEDIEEQGIVSNIFAMPKEYEDEDKAVRDHIKSVLKGYYDYKLLNFGDASIGNELIELRKRYIDRKIE